MAGQGGTSRRGARRGTRPPRRLQPRLAGLGAAALAALVAWGFLVWAAIDFGRTARGGDDQAWVFLGVASLGAVACLFLSLLLVTTLLRKVGVLEERGPAAALRLGRGLSGRAAAARTQPRPGLVDRRHLDVDVPEVEAERAHPAVVEVAGRRAPAGRTSWGQHPQTLPLVEVRSTSTGSRRASPPYPCER